MRNRDLAIKFAQGATKGKTGSMFIEGNVIYSYGHHFPLAVRVISQYISGKFFINKDKYSRTTSIHQTAVRMALEESGARALVPVSTNEIITISKYPNVINGVISHDI